MVVAGQVRAIRQRARTCRAAADATARPGDFAFFETLGRAVVSYRVSLHGRRGIAVLVFAWRGVAGGGWHAATRLGLAGLEGWGRWRLR